MENIIFAPSVNVNDDVVLLSEWFFKCGDLVTNNSLICSIETTKSNLDVETEFQGYLFYKINKGETVKVGELLAVISDDPNFIFEKLLIKNDLNTSEKKENNDKVKWTLKAEKLCEKHKVLKTEVEKLFPNEIIINELIVNDFLQKNNNVIIDRVIENKIDTKDIADSIYFSNKQERVLILGAGGGAALAIDIISRNPKQRAVGILDNNPQLSGKFFMGVPILGSFELVEKLLESDFFDSAISTIVKDVDEREKIYLNFLEKGVVFTNVISENVHIRLNVNIGKGNLITSCAFIGPCTIIGDNNFFAAGAIIEHHNKIGSNCTFGPNFTTSGAVEIGNNCKFGMGVLIEPYIKIGDKCLIASGNLIINHVKENSIIQVSGKVNISK
jgi:sugar O-acyltransferase (sialic acid O-acetyltransferase NeuD family)